MNEKKLIRPDLDSYAPASNLKLNEQVKQMIADGKNICHFGFGQSPFPVMESLCEGLKKYAHVNDYLSVNGAIEFREAICNFHNRYDHLNITPEQIVVAPGSKELLFLLMLVTHGDIMIPSPAWTTYMPQTKLAGRRAVTIVTCFADQWRLTPEILEKTIKEKCTHDNKLLILCNPDNPTGTSYTKEQLQEISAVLRKHSVVVISDEIYARTNYKNAHYSIANCYKEGTIITSGMSKWSSLGGWRLGYTIIPEELNQIRTAITSAGSHTYSCAPAPMQYALAELLQNPVNYEPYMKHTRRILEAVSIFCYEELTSVGVKCFQPTSGFYMMPDFEIVRSAMAKKNITTCEEMCADLFKNKSVVVMAGGPAFLRPFNEFSVRLCFINFDGTTALNASQTLGLDRPLTREFVEEFCAPTVKGIRAIKEWVLENS